MSRICEPYCSFGFARVFLGSALSSGSLASPESFHITSKDILSNTDDSQLNSPISAKNTAHPRLLQVEFEKLLVEESRRKTPTEETPCRAASIVDDDAGLFLEVGISCCIIMKVQTFAFISADEGIRTFENSGRVSSVGSKCANRTKMRTLLFQKETAYLQRKYDLNEVNEEKTKSYGTPSCFQSVTVPDEKVDERPSIVREKEVSSKQDLLTGSTTGSVDNRCDTALVIGKQRKSPLEATTSYLSGGAVPLMRQPNSTLTISNVSFDLSVILSDSTLVENG